MSITQFPVFDGHNDVLLRLLRDGVSFFERSDHGHLDLPRAQEGWLAGGFCAVFVPSPYVEGMTADSMPNSAAFPPTPTMEEAQIFVSAAVQRLMAIEEQSHGKVRIVRTAQDIEECIRDGVFAALFHMEGAEAIDSDLEMLHVYHAAGMRSLGMVWSRPNIFGEGVPFQFPHSPDTGPGLTEAGRRLVAECNRLNIMVDLSHLNEAGFWDVASLSTAPLVATHSNAHALAPASRNLSDRQLDAIRDSDGMVGVNFAVAFLRADGGGSADTPLDLIVRHIDYLAERVGIDRVGFGSDFDGARIPADLGSAAGLPRLVEALREDGYDADALARVTHGNWIRVLRATWGE